jgi:hypothetical protein
MGISQLFKNTSHPNGKPETRLKESPFLQKIVRMPTYRESAPALTAEIDRARRYQRPLSLAIVQFDEPPQGLEHAGGADSAPAYTRGLYPELLVAMVLGAALKDSLRTTDLLSYHVESGCYVVMMPELTAAQAHLAAQRLNDLVLARIFAPLRVGIAQFPRDGWTLQELFSAAERDCSSVAGLHLAPETAEA